jgi:hypothetical protein
LICHASEARDNATLPDAVEVRLKIPPSKVRKGYRLRDAAADHVRDCLFRGNVGRGESHGTTVTWEAGERYDRP